MTTVLIALGSFVLYILAYRTYGRYLARRVFRVDPERPTPACELEDGVDYVPSRRAMVFGHHFTSIAGTGPIVGPAVAVVWGWVPALVWVLVGSVVMGAVHDFGSLVVSMRHRGRTVADLAGDVVNARVRLLFLIVVVVGLWIVLAVFGLVIATVFARFPSSVLPVMLQVPIAVGLGLWVRARWGLLPGTLIAVALMYATIWFSASVDWENLWGSGSGILPASITNVISPVAFWTLVLLAYVWVASVLPVQWLLQPRDYINTWQLLVAMGLLLAGLLVARPPIVADAVVMNPEPAASGASAPAFVPFLFVTIACGAISGFHCLVSSGCSSRQLRTEGDAQAVGFGAMLTEGFLAVLVILACCAGIGLGTTVEASQIPIKPPVPLPSELPPSETAEFHVPYVPLPAEFDYEATGEGAWKYHYGAWSPSALGLTLATFVRGAANFMHAIGIPLSLGTAIMGVFVASFAATTLDSATRLQRYVIAELAGASRRTSGQPGCAACGYSLTGVADDIKCPECGSTRRTDEIRAGVVSRCFSNRFVATTIAVVSAALLALSDGRLAFKWSSNAGPWISGTGGWRNIGSLWYLIDMRSAGTGGLILWPVFGATNQLLGGLALLVITVWLIRSSRPAWVSAVPMVFMLAVTGWAIVSLTVRFAPGEGGGGNPLLLGVSVLMLALEVWIVVEGARLVLANRRRGVPADGAAGGESGG